MTEVSNNPNGFGLGTRCGRGHENAIGFGCGYGNLDCSGSLYTDGVGYSSGDGDSFSMGSGSGDGDGYGYDLCKGHGYGDSDSVGFNDCCGYGYGQNWCQQYSDCGREPGYGHGLGMASYAGSENGTGK